MRPKLTMLRGLPASGKSTWAIQHVKETPNTIRVNKDSLRKMLYGGAPWSGKREKLTKQLEKNVVFSTLKARWDVIVDDTNLWPGDEVSWRAFAVNMAADFEVKDFESSLWTSIFRDINRPADERVGRAVIERMALFAKKIQWPEEKFPIVIVDIDGTLSDPSERLKFIQGPKKDYDGFNNPDNVRKDGVNKVVVEWVRKLWYARVSAGEPLTIPHSIVLVSGRPDSTGDATIEWLRKYDIPFDHLFMRRTGDYRQDTIVKHEIFEALVWSLMAQYKETWDVAKARVAFAIDDRPSIIQMWRDEGVKVYPVHQDRWANGDKQMVDVPMS